jgi:antiviral helicase SLH1
MQVSHFLNKLLGKYFAICTQTKLGLHIKDRAISETLFKKNYARILITTSTLAWGVNLPAHLVIIKVNF